MVNFVSIFCPELQKLLKPIYDLTRKGKQFVWGVEQQNAFEEIKQRLQKRLQQQVVLCMRFRMENPSALHMQGRDYQKQHIIIP